MSIFSKLKELFGDAQALPNEPEDKINQSASMIISILAEALDKKGRASSPEMLLTLGTLTGQLALRSRSGEKINSANAGDTVLVEGVSDRVYELHHIMRHNCEKGPLKKALLEGVDLPEIEPEFIISIIKECLPEIEALFVELKLPKEHQDLAGAMAILIAIQNVKDEFNEDISGTLPYVTHAMVAGSHSVIK
jgi:hypothetical protein